MTVGAKICGINDADAMRAAISSPSEAMPAAVKAWASL